MPGCLGIAFSVGRRQGSFIPSGGGARCLIEIFAQHGPLTFVRIGCSTHADTPKEHKLGLEYNVATIGFVHGIDAAGARIALHNEDLLRSGCIKVDFCAGHEHDVGQTLAHTWDSPSGEKISSRDSP